LAVKTRHGSAVRGDARFDAFDLADRGACVEGSFDAQARPRLEDRLAPGPATLAYRITGIVDARGHPALTVELDGTVPLTCQRCLETFSLPVQQRTVLLLARDDAELARLDEDDEHEVVLAAAALDPLVLAEDELLLTLPYSPRHAEGRCPTGAGVGGAGSDGDSTPARTPFGSLATLTTPRRSKS
jgi:DUF177 domain-containing protein